MALVYKVGGEDVPVLAGRALEPLRPNIAGRSCRPRASNKPQEQGVANGEERILRLKTVLERTGLNRSTLYRKIDEGSTPGARAMRPRD